MFHAGSSLTAAATAAQAERDTVTAHARAPGEACRQAHRSTATQQRARGRPPSPIRIHKGKDARQPALHQRVVAPHSLSVQLVRQDLQGEPPAVHLRAWRLVNHPRTSMHGIKSNLCYHACCRGWRTPRPVPPPSMCHGVSGQRAPPLCTTTTPACMSGWGPSWQCCPRCHGRRGPRRHGLLCRRQGQPSPPGAHPPATAPAHLPHLRQLAGQPPGRLHEAVREDPHRVLVLLPAPVGNGDKALAPGVQPARAWGGRLVTAWGKGFRAEHGGGGFVCVTR